jgi:hypothetical protein
MKLCLIGSTRFMDLYQNFNRRLTMAGHIVYSVAMVSSAERGTNGPNISDLEKIRLDLVHLKKILESDAVVIVTDQTRYVGESTRRELDWARLNGKKVYYGESFERLTRAGIWWAHERAMSADERQSSEN